DQSWLFLRLLREKRRVVVCQGISGSASSRRDGGGSRSQFSVRVCRGRPGGRPARTLRTIYCTYQTGLRPKPPRSFKRIWYAYLGLAEVCRGRLDAAIEQFKRAISSGNPTYFPYAWLAGAEAAKGNDAKAISALAEARRLNPQLTIKWLTTETPTP